MNDRSSIESLLKENGFSPSLCYSDDLLEIKESERHFIREQGNIQVRLFIGIDSTPMMFALEFFLNGESVSKEFNQVIVENVDNIEFYLSRSFSYIQFFGSNKLKSKYY